VIPFALRYLGHAAFALEIAGQRVLFDPHRPGVLGGRMRLPPIDGTFDIIALTHRHEDHAALDPALGDYTLIETPCSRGALRFDTRPAFHDASGGLHMGLVRCVSLLCGDLRLVHCGDLGEVDDDLVRWLSHTDILLVPVGGTYTLDGAQAADLTHAVCPRVVVPMHAADPRVSLPLESVDRFFEALAWPRVDLSVLDALPPNPRAVWLAAP